MNALNETCEKNNLNTLIIVYTPLDEGYIYFAIPLATPRNIFFRFLSQMMKFGIGWENGKSFL